MGVKAEGDIGKSIKMSFKKDPVGYIGRMVYLAQKIKKLQDEYNKMRICHNSNMEISEYESFKKRRKSILAILRKEGG